VITKSAPTVFPTYVGRLSVVAKVGGTCATQMVDAKRAVPTPIRTEHMAHEPGASREDAHPSLGGRSCSDCRV
jgi:hypothetical protein